jgi:hypothetical protein
MHHIHRTGDVDPAGFEGLAWRSVTYMPERVSVLSAYLSGCLQQRVSRCDGLRRIYHMLRIFWG